MPIGKGNQQVPAQPIQSARSGNPQRSQTRRFGEHQITVGAGRQGEGLIVDTERAGSPSPRHRTGLLSRVAGTAARSAAGVLPGMTRRGRQPGIGWPEGRPGGPIDKGVHQDGRTPANSAYVGTHPDRPGAGAAGAGGAGTAPAYAEPGPVYEEAGGGGRSRSSRCAHTRESHYARVGGLEENSYESVRGQLDAAVSLFGPESPLEVVEALQPIYETMRDCAAAMNRSGNTGEIENEDISIVCESLVEAMRPLVAVGQIDEGVLENIQVYAKRVDPGFAEVNDAAQGADR